jgi:hypothetical protein
MNIRLNIERLVIDGLPLGSAGADALRAAVEGELSRLLGEGGLAGGLQTGGALPVLRGGAVRAGDPSDPGRLGRQIAGAIYEGIGKK